MRFDFLWVCALALIPMKRPRPADDTLNLVNRELASSHTGGSTTTPRYYPSRRSRQATTTPPSRPSSQRARRLSIARGAVRGSHQGGGARQASPRGARVCDRGLFLEVEVGAEVALEAREDALGRVVRAPGDGHELAVGLARGHVLDGEAARPVGDAEARRLPVSRRRRGRVFHAVVVLRWRRQISIY